MKSVAASSSSNTVTFELGMNSRNPPMKRFGFPFSVDVVSAFRPNMIDSSMSSRGRWNRSSGTRSTAGPENSDW